MFISKAYYYMQSTYLGGKNYYKRLSFPLAAIFIITMLADFTYNDSLIFSMRFGEIFFLAACIMAVTAPYIKNGEPELKKTLPISRKCRTVYDYVIPIIMGVACTIFLTIFYIVFTVLFGLVTWASYGENPFIYEAESIGSSPILWGELASIFRFAACFSLFEIVAHRQKDWWIWLIAATVILIAWTLIPNFISSDKNNIYSFYNSFGVMPLAWVYVLVTGLLSAAIFALSVILVYHSYKPKDY